MAVYINALEAISPQNTFDTDDFLTEIILPEAGYFSCIRPDYKLYVPSKLLRRMSAVIKMGLGAAKKCLLQAEIDNPDAIVVGTGLGCIEDTLKFLNQIDDNKEGLLTPTAFIQSTHNTVSGQIALLLNCKNENLTFTQRTISFETALLDASLMLEDKPDQNILLGGIDEITPASYALLLRTGCTKQNHKSPYSKVTNQGYVPGEGATFFVVSNQKSDKNLVEMKHLAFNFRPVDTGQISEFINEEVERAEIKLNEIDVIVTGVNGDFDNDNKYRDIFERTCSESACVAYKHLTGEYDTANAFGLWLGVKIIHHQKIPDCVKLNHKRFSQIRNILILNHDKGKNYSLILLSKC